MPYLIMIFIGVFSYCMLIGDAPDLALVVLNIWVAASLVHASQD